MEGFEPRTMSCDQFKCSKVTEAAQAGNTKLNFFNVYLLTVCSDPFRRESNRCSAPLRSMEADSSNIEYFKQKVWFEAVITTWFSKQILIREIGLEGQPLSRNARKER
jgi:hypothetical protein